jgi:hypothetical protein
LGAKHAFLRAGLGWGGMPFAMVERDLADGLLVEIKLQDEQADGFIMPDVCDLSHRLSARTLGPVADR